MTSPGDGLDHTSLGQGGEFDRIRAIWERLGDRAAPSGDDCAIVRVGDELLAVGTDMAVEDVHFRMGWLEPVEIGRRAAFAALSDLAAMAAEPLGVLTSVGLSAEWPEEMVTQLIEGIADAAARVGATLWGGDLVRSEVLIIDMVVVGRAKRPLRRRGGRAGDGVWVTGALGAPAAALAAWNRCVEPDRAARERFAHPIPRVQEAVWLAEHGARAMLDISDGLVNDAGHLAAASGVQCVIDADRVPVHPAADSPEQALVSGEEYELLVALPPDFGHDAAREFENAFQLGLTSVGQLDAGTGVRLVRDGAPLDLPHGFRHF